MAKKIIRPAVEVMPQEMTPPKIDPDAFRQLFEAWAIRERGFSEIAHRGEDGEYLNPWTREKWAEWQKR